MRQEDYPDMATLGKPCVPWEQVIQDVMIAHAYVPWQNLCTLQLPMKALKCGTVFAELTNLYGLGREMAR